jgi:hypothetical protein
MNATVAAKTMTIATVHRLPMRCMVPLETSLTDPAMRRTVAHLP